MAFRKLFFKKVSGSRSSYVLEEGDIALDESDGKLYRGDGSTPGGIVITPSAGIQLTDISTATSSASGGGGLVYNNGTGQLTFTPADVSGGGGGISNVVEDTTPQLGGNLDAQTFDITTTGKILFANMYATEGDLPNATTYHGMFAHVHATGAGYFAHGGNWIKLANYTDLSAYQTTGGLGTNIDLHLNQSNPTSGYVLSWNGADYAWVSNAGGGGISNLVEDTTPQLGGNLDVNGNSITSSGDLTLDVTGDIVLDAGGEQIIFKDGSTNVGHIDLTDDDLIIKSLVSDADIVFKGNDNGTERTPFYLDMSVGGTAMFNAGIKNSNFFWCTTDNIVALQAGANGEIDLTHVHNTGFKLTNAGTGTPAVELQFVDADESIGSDGTNLLLKSGGTTFKIPTADGTSGQVLQTDGNGVLSFTTVSGGGGLSNVVEDTTPQLGGALDTNGNNITFSGTDKAQFGAAQDLSIFHNNNHSIIRETGTGDLYLQSDNNVILSTDTSTKKMVKGVGSGEVILYHNDVQKLNTSTSGVTVVDEVHTEGATPHLTLKRTDNANIPTIRFKGSGGVIGASIDFQGTAGTSNELAFQVYDGASIAERFRVTYTGAKVTGNLNIASGVHEKFATLTGATGTVAHDCATAQIFYHTGAAANFTANFTNLTLAQEDATNLAIVINQGGSAYIPNAVQIGGAAQTIIWQGNSAPSGTANGTDSFSFTILNDGGTYVVLGQMVTFGGV